MRGLAWGDLQFVKVVTFDSAEWRMLSVEARGLFLLLYRAADRSGTILLGPLRPERVGAAVAVLLSGDKEYCTKAIAELIETGFLNITNASGRLSLVIPEFVEAQAARMADKVRAQQYRERRHADAISSRPVDVMSQPKRDLSVSSNSIRHTTSTDVTIDQRSEIRDDRSDTLDQKGECEGDQVPKTDPNPSLRGKKLDDAVGKATQALNLEEIKAAAPEPLVLATTTAADSPKLKTKGKTKAPASTPNSTTEPTEHLLPPDWTPTQSHYDTGAKYGMAKYQVDFEAMAFRNHAEGCDRKQTRWNGAFSTWLLKDIKDRGDRPHRAPKPVAVEPPRSVPPPPPLHPMVAEGARKAREMMEQNPNMSLRELLDFSTVGKNYSFDDVDTVNT